MKKNTFRILIVFALVVGVMTFAGSRKASAPLFTYVYSDSMVPTIKINDVFMIVPGTNYEVGDIIMFRPQVLEAEYVVHRIVDIGEEGYITKGDNSSYKDQEIGEPMITKEQVIGRVATINGNPILIPGLGKYSAAIKTDIGRYAKYLSYLFLILGLISALAGAGKKHKLKPRHRMRLGHLYRIVTITAAIIIMSSITLGSKLTQVRYLVSEYPGTLGNQVEKGEPRLMLSQLSSWRQACIINKEQDAN